MAKSIGTYPAKFEQTAITDAESIASSCPSLIFDNCLRWAHPILRGACLRRHADATNVSLELPAAACHRAATSCSLRSPACELPCYGYTVQRPGSLALLLTESTVLSPCLPAKRALCSPCLPTEHASMWPAPPHRARSAKPLPPYKARSMWPAPLHRARSV